MKKAQWIFFLWILVFSRAAGAAEQASTRCAPDEVLIRFLSTPASGSLETESKRLAALPNLQALRAALLAREGLKPMGTLEVFRIEKFKLPPGKSPQEASASLRQSPLVQFCEPNFRRKLFSPLATGGPDDPYYASGDQWWLEAIQMDRAFADHLPPQGGTTIIAIVDTGISLTHPDLTGRLVSGIDLINGGDGLDIDGHGTHVAGIAAASTNNGIGIAGTAWLDSIRLMPVKVIEGREGEDYTIADGIRWAVDHGARVVNLSLGGPDPSQTLNEAVVYAHQKGCVVVASAGNDALDENNQPYNPVEYPAAYPYVIAVAATNRAGERAYYSNSGDYVDVAAPGGVSENADALGIWSTYPGWVEYYTEAGTSMACPMVTGIAALLLARNATLTPEEVESILTTTAEKIGQDGYSQGWNPYLGWGQVNGYRALTLNTTYMPRSEGRASYNYPNPFRPGIGEKTYVVVPQKAGDAPSAVRLKIFDAMGHLVHSEERAGNTLWPGGVLSWDGKNDRGHPAANGIYPYRLEIDGTVYTNKIAVKN